MTTNPTATTIPMTASVPVAEARQRAAAHVRTAPILWGGLALIILVSLLLAASTWRVYSNTWDEPEHLAAGVELLDRGRYEYDTEHPPIVRALMALGPYLAGAHSFGTPPPDGTQEGIDILYGSGHYELYLTLARLGTLPFLALLLFSAWLWARRILGSSGPALLAVLLLASVPPILGHAALATLDVPAAATMLLAFYALQRWISTARWRDALFFGVAAGIAVGSKFSAIPFLGLGLIALAATHLLLNPAAAARARAAAAGAGSGEAAPTGWSLTQVAARRLAGLAVVALVAAIPIVVAYGARSPSANGVITRFNWAVSYLLQEHGLAHDAGALLSHLWLPRALKGFIEGIVAVKAHNDSGHVSYLLGTIRSTGWWYFYLVALAVKTPLPLLATGPAGMALLARDGWRDRDPWRLAPAVLFLTVLGFASFFSRINIGIRHVLVLYPFMALGAAYLLAVAWHRFRNARQRHLAMAGTAIVFGLTAWQVSTLWTANPDYLPYFNEAVAHPDRVLVDSDLDWGQDLHRLEQRCAALKVPRLNLAWRGTADLSREPLPPLSILPPWHPTTGWIALSALAREHDIAGYGWLNAFTPVEKVGKTIDLYYIPEGTTLPPPPPGH